MKRYFLKILLSVTAILFVVLVSTTVSFAQESNIGAYGKIQNSIYTTDNDTSEYETIKDEHGYKVVLKNTEQENSQLLSANRYQAYGDSVIGREDLDNFVRLKIPEKATDIYGLTLNCRYYPFEIDGTYSGFSQYRCMNEAQTSTTITVGEFDWSFTDRYSIMVDTVHGIYKTEITQADLTSAITLSMDSTYTTVTLSVPFDLSTYKNYGLDFLAYDDQGKFITNYYLDKNDITNGYKIPSGHYKIQAFAEGSENAFSLWKDDYDLTPSTKTITFSDNDMAKVSFSMSEGNSTGKQVTVTKAFFLNFSPTYSVVPSYSNNIPYIYVTKKNYSFIGFTTKTNDNWAYEFTVRNVDASAGPLTVKYDLNLKTEFSKPIGDVYGRYPLGYFHIRNSNGQMVDSIWDYSGQLGQPNNKVIKLTRGSESYTFYNLSTYIFNLPNPSVSGTFTVDFSALGPLAVTPLKDSIYINRSNALADDAELYYDVPASMNEGQTGYIYVTARNTGTNVWNSAGGYKLVAAGGSDPLTSTLSYPIPEGVSIKENMEYEFKIPITAPTRGIYTTDWHMSNGTTTFGTYTPKEICVRSTNNPYLSKPISITSLTPDKASPQMAGTMIRWTCNITGGADQVYYFKIFKGSALVKSSTSYTASNYFDWTPAEAGTDYRAMVYVKENGSASTTAVTKFSGYFTVNAPTPIAITSVVPDKTSPQLTGTTIRWTCNITGGVDPVYYFKVFKGSTLVKSSTSYTSTNYFDWTPTKAGDKYRVMVYAKENGKASTTAVTKFSSYFTVNTPPIVIELLGRNKSSPQILGATIRWTCDITGGIDPVYYFKIFNGSTLIQSSPAFSATNYIDWTPAEVGDKYRVMVYVKENGASTTTAVTKMSSYFIVNTPIAITSLVPNRASPQKKGETIRWTCNITGGCIPFYYFKVFDGSTLVDSSTEFTWTNYFDWIPSSAGNKYRVMVYVKENGASSATADTMMSGYYTITETATPLAITSLVPDKISPQTAGTTIRWTCNIASGSDPVYFFKVFDGSTLIQSSGVYTFANYIDWTPALPGSKYRVMVYVRENGSSTATAVTKMSEYYTVN